MRLWDFHDFGEAGDKGGKGGESFGFVTSEAADDARHAVVHLMGNHADDTLIGGFLSQTHLGGQRFDEKERMLETTVRKGLMANTEKLWFTR